MKSSLIRVILRVFILLTMGSLSIVYFLLKNPANQIFIPQGEIDATKYGFSLRTSSGEQFLFGIPLNDFYYHSFSKTHLLDKVLESKRGGVGEELLTTIKSVFLNEKSVKISFGGRNHDGNGEISYRVKYSGNKIEVEREITLDKNFDAIGQTIVVCSGCFVADDKERLYLNQGFLTQDVVEFATKMNLVPLVIGENQFFPAGASRIIVLNGDGKTVMQMPTYANEQILLQGGWNILEFRIPVQSAKNVKIKQVIYL